MKSIATTTRTFLWSIAVVSSIVLSTSAGRVLASEKGESDGKIYPGAICVPTQHHHFTDINSIKYSWDGRFEIRDAGPFTTRVVCPVIRDNTYATRGLQNVQIYFNDNNPSENVSCYVAAWDMPSNRLLKVSSRRSSTTVSGRGNFFMNYPIKSSTNATFYTVNCDVPGAYNGARSSIDAISVSERP